MQQIINALFQRSLYSSSRSVSLILINPPLRCLCSYATFYRRWTCYTNQYLNVTKFSCNTFFFVQSKLGLQNSYVDRLLKGNKNKNTVIQKYWVFIYFPSQHYLTAPNVLFIILSRKIIFTRYIESADGNYG